MQHTLCERGGTEYARTADVPSPVRRVSEGLQGQERARHAYVLSHRRETLPLRSGRVIRVLVHKIFLYQVFLKT